MTAALAFLAGAVLAGVAVHHTHRHHATAIADRDDALDQLARERSLRLYAERSLDHWIEKAVSR